MLYYSISWFNPASGYSKQSFREAAEALNVKYIIVDDAFIARSFLDRGVSWTDSMINEIADHWKLLRQIGTSYYVGNRVPDPELFPSTWHYPGLRKDYVSRIIVYKKSEE